MIYNFLTDQSFASGLLAYGRDGLMGQNTTPAIHKYGARPRSRRPGRSLCTPEGAEGGVDSLINKKGWVARQKY